MFGSRLLATNDAFLGLDLLAKAAVGNDGGFFMPYLKVEKDVLYWFYQFKNADPEK